MRRPLAGEADERRRWWDEAGAPSAGEERAEEREAATVLVGMWQQPEGETAFWIAGRLREREKERGTEEPGGVNPIRRWRARMWRVASRPSPAAKNSLGCNMHKVVWMGSWGSPSCRSISVQPSGMYCDNSCGGPKWLSMFELSTSSLVLRCKERDVDFRTAKRESCRLVLVCLGEVAV